MSDQLPQQQVQMSGSSVQASSHSAMSPVMQATPASILAPPLTGVLLPTVHQMQQIQQMQQMQQMQQFIGHTGLSPSVQSLRFSLQHQPQSPSTSAMPPPGSVPLAHHPVSQMTAPQASSQTVVPSTSAMPPPSSTCGTAPGPIRRRRFSTAKIQPTRIKKVMQSDEEIGRMVASVPVSIGRAMEHFAEQFLKAAAAATQFTNSRTLTPTHMKMAMLATPHFAFLEPLLKDVAVPGRIGSASSPESDAQIMRLSMQLGYGTQNQQQSSLNPYSTPSLSQLASPQIGQPAQLSSPLLPSPNPATSTTSLSHYGMPTMQMVNPYQSIGMTHASANSMQMTYDNNMPMGVHQMPHQMGHQIGFSTVLDPSQPQTIGGFAYPDMKPPQAQQMQNTNTIQQSSVTEALGRKASGKRTLSANGNGTHGEQSEKPKRGRPRKAKKSDKCLDDELCEEVTNGLEKEEKEEKDRELMPPPALPLMGGKAKPIA